MRLRRIIMNRLAVALFTLAFLTGLAAAQAKPSPEPAPNSQTTTGKAAVPLVIPEAEKNRKNPVPAGPESIESGRNLFSSQCTMCHGMKGDGKGDLVERLKLKVPDFTDAGAQKKRTDGELFYILTQGHGEMPGETRLESKDKWDMVNYIRSLSLPGKPKK
jgi:cytochrome c